MKRVVYFGVVGLIAWHVVEVSLTFGIVYRCPAVEERASPNFVFYF